MLSSNKVEAKLLALVPPWFGGPIVRWIALLGLCAAYLQGGFNKLIDFPGAIAEMQHFGLSPPALLAAITITLELGASIMILAGIYRWIGALSLAAFRLMAIFGESSSANRGLAGIEFCAPSRRWGPKYFLITYDPQSNFNQPDNEKSDVISRCCA
jgi:uncharacterized membrane protein YphA (DoxX/SURF4 family)